MYFIILAKLKQLILSLFLIVNIITNNLLAVSSNVSPSTTESVIYLVLLNNYCVFTNKIRGTLSHDFKCNLNNIKNDAVVELYGLVSAKLLSPECSLKLNEIMLSKKISMAYIKQNVPNDLFSDLDDNKLCDIFNNSEFSIDKTALKTKLVELMRTQYICLLNVLYYKLKKNNIHYSDNFTTIFSNTSALFLSDEQQASNSVDKILNEFCQQYFICYSNFNKKNNLKNACPEYYINESIIELLKNRNIENESFNFACAVINAKINDDSKTGVMILKQSAENELTYNISSDELLEQSIILQYNNNAISNVKIAIDNLSKLIRRYHNYIGKSQISDDEFKILCTLIIKANEICNKINTVSNNIKEITIETFTFMDMCPSCWMAWNIMIEPLKKMYQALLKNNSLKLRVNVYSIKPFYDQYHFFIEKYNLLNNIITNNYEHVKLSDWDKIDLHYRRHSNANGNALTVPFSQSIDMDGVKLVQDIFLKQ